MAVLVCLPAQDMPGRRGFLVVGKGTVASVEVERVVLGQIRIEWRMDLPLETNINSCSICG